MTLTVAALRQSSTADRDMQIPGVLASPQIRFLDPSGELTELGKGEAIDIDLARHLFAEMVRVRAIDKEAVALQRQGELGLWLQCLGQEAAQVGSAAALDPTDYIFPSYREHGVALYRGVSGAALLSQWRGVAHAGWDRASHNLHFYSLVLGTQTLHATGYAMGVQRAGAGLVAVYLGDGAASQGDVAEAMNWAAVQDLPILFICQNNQWAISTPTSIQTGTPLHVRAAGYGLASWHVDGNDALAVSAVTRTAAHHVRSGGGPAFIEMATFRMGGHSTSDDPRRYRDDAEVEEWRGKDPIDRLERFLAIAGTERGWFEEVRMAARGAAADVRDACFDLQPPRLDDLFGNVYSSPHATIDRDLASYVRLREVLAEEGGVA